LQCGTHFGPLHLSDSVASEVKSLNNMAQTFYVDKSLVDPRYLERPVAYQTSYSSSNWVPACSWPKNLVSRLVSPGDSVGEDSLPTFSPSYQSKCWGGCLDALGDCSGHLVQPLATPGPQVLAFLLKATWVKSICKTLDHAWIDQAAVLGLHAGSLRMQASVDMGFGRESVLQLLSILRW
jgi:hypothetical protein